MLLLYCAEIDGFAGHAFGKVWSEHSAGSSLLAEQASARADQPLFIGRMLCGVDSVLGTNLVKITKYKFFRNTVLWVKNSQQLREDKHQSSSHLCISQSRKTIKTFGSSPADHYGYILVERVVQRRFH